MTTIGTHLLGRTVEHDPANWGFPFPIRKLTRPVNRSWVCGAAILDQGELGSCEGNTAAEWTNCKVALNNRRLCTLPNRSPRWYLTERDAVTLYSKATQLDDDGIDTKYPPDDTGTSAVGIAKAMQFYKIITRYEWTFSWEHFLAAIDRQPVMLGTDWYTGMFDPDKSGYVEISGTIDGGHAYLARGIDYKNQRVRCRNHWTTDWGLNGEFWLRFSTLQRLLDAKGDVLVPGLVAA